MEEESCRRNHVGAIMSEELGRENQEGEKREERGENNEGRPAEAARSPQMRPPEGGQAYSAP